MNIIRTSRNIKTLSSIRRFQILTLDSLVGGKTYLVFTLSPEGEASIKKYRVLGKPYMDYPKLTYSYLSPNRLLKVLDLDLNREHSYTKTGLGTTTLAKHYCGYLHACFEYNGKVLRELEALLKEDVSVIVSFLLQRPVYKEYASEQISTYKWLCERTQAKI